MPEVIDTLADTDGPVIAGTVPAWAPVAVALAAVDILHNQPELPGSARDRPYRLAAAAGRSCPRLTARANLSSDDLAVIRHALTAVAEVKVRA